MRTRRSSTRNRSRAEALAVALSIALSGFLPGCGTDDASGPSTDPPDDPPAQPLPGIWAVAASLPQPLTESGAGAMGGRIYVAGGRASLTLSPRVYQYDPGTNRWSALPDLPEALRRPGVAALGDTLLVGGGNAAAPDGPDAPRRTVYALPPGATAWIEHSSLPDWLDGSMTSTGAGILAWLEGSVAILTPGSRTWTPFAPPPSSRQVPFCCGPLLAEGQSVWAVGPVQPPVTARLDLTIQDWRDVRTLGSEATRVGGAWVLGGRLHLLTSESNLNRVVRLNADGTSQALLAPGAEVFGNQRREAVPVALDGRLYLIGGENNSGGQGPAAQALSRVDVFTPPS